MKRTLKTAFACIGLSLLFSIGANAQTIKIEVEDWQSATGVEISEQYNSMLTCKDGCGGPGKAKFSYRFDVEEAGRYELIVTYSHNDPDNNAGRPVNIDVNGVNIFKDVMNKRTGGWYKTNAQDDTIGTVDLKKGKNTVTFKPKYLVAHIAAIRLEKVD